LIYTGYIGDVFMVRDNLVQWVGMELWKFPEWYTRKEIANAIGCKKSPSVIWALEAAVKEGVLEQRRARDSHGRLVILYRITSEYRETMIEEARNFNE
jgi:DNA-binding PadR family transcriptional regulator